MVAVSDFGRTVGLAGRSVLNALLPPRCLSCGGLVSATGSLCPSCWQGIDFLAPPHCGICGLPFAYDPGPEVFCGACLRRRPDFDRARAVLRYDDQSRGLVLGFKHGDRTEAAPAYAAWLERAGAELLTEAEMILPVLGGLSKAIEVNPLFLMIPATLSCSCAFMMPVATPPNAIVFGSERLRILDMVKTGLILNFIGVVLIVGAMATLGGALWGIDLGVFPDWARPK